MNKVREAYEFAKEAHHGQLRKSGEPYIIHPLRTAELLTGLHVDEDTLVAAFLHDIPEDTKITLAQIESRFGKKIAYLVDGITKLSKVQYRETMEQRHIESLKKLFIHCAEDLRVILIKLADRLDNMKTLCFISDEKKRTRIAKETLEIYVPIANLLGIGEIRTELEDLCFQNLHPLEHSKLKKEVEEKIEERGFILNEMIHITSKELDKEKMEAEIIGRPKTLFSIHKKLQTKQSIYNIEDLIAVRIIVPTREDCYQVLNIIHHLFKPKMARIKDYIAVPKPNGYQSLHTTVFGINGSIIEFQIRTRYMHLEAEYGIAAHYFYKYSNEQELANIMQQRSGWVQRILEMQKDNNDSKKFLEHLKLDVFQDRIFVFSPKGDVIDLPHGACAVDFAYAIHSDVGNRAVKAEINKNIYPITTILKNGDTVKIMTDKENHPERDWLQFAKTGIAINKIKEYLKHEPVDIKRTTGRKFLQKEFDRIGKNFIDELTSKRIKIITKELPYKNLDDLIIAIGEGNLSPQDIVNILQENKQLDTGNVSYIGREGRGNKDFHSRVGLLIIGDNGKNQFREIIRTVNALQIQIVKFIVTKPWYAKRHRCHLTVMVKNYSELAQVFEGLERIDGVDKIRRLFIRRQLIFTLYSIITIGLWLSHPFVIHSVLLRWKYAGTISSIVIYSGTAMLFVLVYYLNVVAKRSLPELAETAFYWPFSYLITTLALFTVLGEIFTFNIHFNWIFVIGLILGVYAMLTSSYVNYKQHQV